MLEDLVDIGIEWYPSLVVIVAPIVVIRVIWRDLMVDVTESERLLHPETRQLSVPRLAQQAILVVAWYLIGRMVVLLLAWGVLALLTPVDMVGFSRSFTGWRASIFDWKPCAQCWIEWEWKLFLLIGLGFVAYDFAKYVLVGDWLLVRLHPQMEVRNGKYYDYRTCWIIRFDIGQRQLFVAIMYWAPLAYALRLWFLPPWYI